MTLVSDGILVDAYSLIRKKTSSLVLSRMKLISNYKFEQLEKGLAEPHGLGQSEQNHLNEVLLLAQANCASKVTHRFPALPIEVVTEQ